MNLKEGYKYSINDFPNSLWVQDWSGIKTCLDRLQQQGITDFNHYFTNNPKKIAEIISYLRIIDVNQATLDLFQDPY